MQITKEVSITTDVNVEITKQDIAEVLADMDSWATGTWFLRYFNDIAQFFKAIPSETITGLTPHQRELINNFLTEQAKRFA